MTNFRKAVKNLVDSNLPDSTVKELLREMLCKSNDCDGVNRFFTQPYTVGDKIDAPRWVS